MSHQFLFIQSRLPQSGMSVAEQLDLILTCAAFDQPVSLLFIDDGVFQLIKNQSPGKMGLKDTAAIFQVLDLYNVDKLFVESQSLMERGLTEECLSLEVTLLARDEVSSLLSAHSILIRD